MNILATISSDTSLTMSSREIAEVCGKQHKHVRRDIKAMIDELGFNDGEYVQLWTDPQNGQSYAEYRLPKDLTVTLITGYRADLRYKVVRRLEELERERGALPDFSDPAAAARAWADQVERNKAQRAEIALMHEDVMAHERLTKADGSLSITEAAKALEMRPRDLFTWLSQNGWTYKRAGSGPWLGYQTKCNQGLLEHKTTTVTRGDGTEKITEQVRITPKGLSKLAKEAI
ncbi:MULTISPECIES: phage antirepressor KilAC domain-containing protein [Marivita]|uniref:Phage regulatory protein/antirepressor Ant n=1 Tax=Marivita cryptomonadis TaxID=505252 RepID=A0A9Q2RXV6_9RHOB|nr:MULTISPECIES: phage regulatory protein/antirepressor Ant [Marivita]MCR9169490.1 phage regulatory protein/antirepressor Ant [Paracoccaceae bacterium]MBM2322246.1 phage regulatory protein/antirepressor Ant [Marivita cryptomonadis]MBM2331828.1 phage regulatory protein/antirepressor Ant [Marivita cryptomonadis]MBM2341412.1 phage regulatory protein/antirepressor Ant [Marivita cryptomonadis]MBM2346076.1 phage regulatory protein/antirepressor Ant [Marivita cryptomonadis]